MNGLRLTSGSVEALKWLALVLMTGDHVNSFLLDRSVPILYDLGRLAFPLFAVVLAYNLARPGADYWRATRRLVLVGLVATWPYTVVTGHVLQLNVLFTFAVAAAAMALWSRSHLASLALVIGLAGFVDYEWYGVGLVLAAWWFFRSQSAIAAAATVGACASLVLVNGNAWALAALPLVIVASHSAPDVPRLRWAFYGFYPVHLAVLALLA